MTTMMALLLLICLTAGMGFVTDDERVGRGFLATAICFITVWLAWFV